MARFNASNKIIVVHYGNVMFYPPVLNLLENLLSNHRNVVLIAGNTDRIPSRILDHDGIFVKDIPLSDSSDPIGRVKRRLCIGRMYKDALDSFYSDDDVVWTTTDSTVRALSTALDGKKHVLQLMELEESFPLFSGARFLKFDLPSYARKAWKVVVPEQNRAYIQQVMWNLPQVPKVLPNKPYSLDPGYADDQISFLLDRLRQEDRKIVMYLGVMSVDRNLGPFAEAVEMMGEDFALYVLGKVPEGQQEVFDALLSAHQQVVYLGFFNPPSHLHFLQYAYIGLLPYISNYKSKVISPLNVLYCAPNKIYEYAGFGVPMVGTDVLGLRIPFEKYNIGVCCESLEPSSISEKLLYVDARHDEMASGCKAFCDETDLDSIVADILG